MSLLDGFEHIVEQDVPLAPHTRLRIGGMAAYFAQPNNLEELCGLIERFHKNEIPIRTIGKGSNVLVPDEGFGGLVIHLSAPAFCQMEVKENGLVCGGGIQLSHMISTAAAEGFSGPEQLVGIPGTVGGALHENTSSHAGNIGAWVKKATVVTATGQVIERDEDDLNFAYRESSLSELAIVSAEFEFSSEPKEDLVKRMQKQWILSKSRQPMMDERCAFVFKDHGGMAIEKILERVDLVGASVGDVSVSDRHSNYFVAEEGAKSADFLKLVELVRSQVHEKTEIELDLGVDVW